MLTGEQTNERESERTSEWTQDYCLPSVCVQQSPLNSCLQLHPTTLGVPPLAHFPWLQDRVSTRCGHGNPPHDGVLVTMRARTCIAPVPQGWLQASHEPQRPTAQFRILHGNERRLLPQNEASVTRARTKNDQNSDVIVWCFNLSSHNKPDHIYCKVWANHPKNHFEFAMKLWRRSYLFQRISKPNKKNLR